MFARITGKPEGAWEVQGIHSRTCQFTSMPAKITGVTLLRDGAIKNACGDDAVRNMHTVEMCC